MGFSWLCYYTSNKKYNFYEMTTSMLQEHPEIMKTRLDLIDSYIHNKLTVNCAYRNKIMGIDYYFYEELPELEGLK